MMQASTAGLALREPFYRRGSGVPPSVAQLPTSARSLVTPPSPSDSTHALNVLAINAVDVANWRENGDGARVRATSMHVADCESVGGNSCRAGSAPQVVAMSCCKFWHTFMLVDRRDCLDVYPRGGNVR